MPNSSVRAAAEGMPKIEMNDAAHNAVENAWGHCREVQHLLHILNHQIEENLSVKRGHRDDNGAICLTFHEDSIDALVWMIGDAWMRTEKIALELNDALARAVVS